MKMLALPLKLITYIFVKYGEEKMKKYFISSLIILFSLTVTHTSSAAGSSSGTSSTWSQSGIACKVSDETSGYSTISGHSFEKTVSSGWVACPIPRTENVSDVYINLNHPSDRTTLCALRRSDDVTGTTESVIKSISGSGNLGHRFSLPTPPAGSGSTDTYSIDCLLDVGTTIWGVDWQQQ